MKTGPPSTTWSPSSGRSASESRSSMRVAPDSSSAASLVIRRPAPSGNSEANKIPPIRSAAPGVIASTASSVVCFAVARLELPDVHGPGALVALLNVERYARALLERPIGRNPGLVDEQVLARLVRRDEAEALVLVEPFDCSRGHRCLRRLIAAFAKLLVKRRSRETLWCSRLAPRFHRDHGSTDGVLRFRARARRGSGR